MHTLQSLLGTDNVLSFLEQNWTQQAVYISGDSGRFQTLFSWAELNDLLNYQTFSSSELRLSQDGQSLPTSHDPNHWRSQLQQGATLILNGIHNRTPQLKQLAAELRQELGYRCHINSYGSPAQQQGFDCHYDTHDVLILQIEGEKEWFIYPETIPYPMPQQFSADQLPPDTDPYLQQILTPGDVLYIPRGHWHYAIACETASLHLTIGIHTSTGLDWLSWLQQELQEESDWRKGLPLAQEGDLNHPVVRQHLEALRDQLITQLQSPQWIDNYLQRLSWQDQPALPLDLPAQLNGDPLVHGFLGEFVWSPLHVVNWRVDEDQIQVRVGSKQITLKGLPLNLAEKLFNCDRFTLLDLGEWAPDLSFEADIAPLLQQLILAGVLLVKEPQAACDSM